MSIQLLQRKKMNRRDFLNTSTKIACACALGATSGLFTSCYSITSSESKDTTGISLEFDLASSDYLPLQSEGGSVTTGSNEVDSNGLLLLREAGTIKVFTNNCTHSGYDLLPFSNGTSICSSGHGGRFNSNGEAISHPASGTLKSYSTTLLDNILIVYGG